MSQVAYSVPLAAASVGVSPDTIRKEIDAGRLRAKKVGTRIVIKATDLEAWVDGLEDAR